MKAALISALSRSQKEDKLFVVDKLSLDSLSTKKVFSCLKSFDLSKTLIVNSNSEKGEQFFNSSAKNIPHIKCLKPEGVNVFDLLKFDNLLVSRSAVEKITERLKNV
jgi:large subunit ribosomal protein L4